MNRDVSVGDCDFQDGVALSNCKGIGSIVSPSYLGEVIRCGGWEREELTSIEDEEVAAFANHQSVGSGGVERQLRVVRGDLCEMGEGDDRQREATVKNG